MEEGPTEDGQYDWLEEEGLQGPPDLHTILSQVSDGREGTGKEGWPRNMRGQSRGYHQRIAARMEGRGRVDSSGPVYPLGTGWGRTWPSGVRTRC